MPRITYTLIWQGCCIIHFTSLCLNMRNVTLFIAALCVISISSCGLKDTTECLPPPAPKIVGPNTVNVGGTIILNTAGGGGGHWKSASVNIATVNSQGLVTGLTAGSVIIMYTLLDAGCGESQSYCNITVTDVPMVVGQSFAGGIIAYVLQPGDPNYDSNVKHGLIAAPADLPDARWNNGFPGVVTFATGSAIGTGSANTDSIMKVQGTSGEFAASVCRMLTLGGNADWYLPSKDELDKLYENRAAIGGFVTGKYWSSTEADDSQAWYRDFGTGDRGSEAKNIYHSVRAVRSF